MSRPTGLVPALQYADAVKGAWQRFAHSPRSQWFHQTSFRDQLTIDDSEWSRIQRAVVREGELIGYLSASIDRDARRVSQLCAVAFAEHDLGFAVALRAFVVAMRAEFEVLHWSTVAGSPNATLYRRACKTWGGRIIGIQRRSIRLPGGALADLELYELLGMGGRTPSGGTDAT